MGKKRIDLPEGSLIGLPTRYCQRCGEKAEIQGAYIRAYDTYDGSPIYIAILRCPHYEWEPETGSIHSEMVYYRKEGNTPWTAES